MDIRRFPESLINFVYTSMRPDPPSRDINVVELQTINFGHTIWILNYFDTFLALAPSRAILFYNLDATGSFRPVSPYVSN